jgi:hypothetical protein
MYRSALAFAALILAACGTTPPVEAQKPSAPPATDPASAAIGRATDNLVLGKCHGESGNLCYDDADGVSQFWIDSFRRTYSAEVRRRQERYNLWIRGVKGVRSLRVSFVEAPLPYRYYRPPNRMLSGNSISMPQSIRATGRLDQDTIAIPFYRSVYRLLTAYDRLERDCERDYRVDNETGSLCNRMASSAMLKDYDRPLTPAELQRFPENFRLRAATLLLAFERSHQQAAALRAVLASAGKSSEALIMDGVNPDDLAPDKLQALDVADVLLAAAIDEVEWAAESYKPIKP